MDVAIAGRDTDNGLKRTTVGSWGDAHGFGGKSCSKTAFSHRPLELDVDAKLLTASWSEVPLAQPCYPWQSQGTSPPRHLSRRSSSSPCSTAWSLRALFIARYIPVHSLFLPYKHRPCARLYNPPTRHRRLRTVFLPRSPRLLSFAQRPAPAPPALPTTLDRTANTPWPLKDPVA